MAEAVKIRLVRCPKCANLLTELPDFSLYKCGGCGAVLQAKKKAFPKDGFTEMPDDAKGVRTSAECNINNMSDDDMESVDGIERGIVKKNHKERVTSTGNSMSRFGNGEPLADFDTSRRGKERTRRLGYDGEKKSYTHGLVRHRNHDEFSDLNINMPEYGNFQEEQRRSGSFPYYGMGPSSYESNSHYEHIERTRFKDQGLHGFARVEKLEHERVELLRKLDELKGQLNHSWDMDDKPNERMVSSIPSDSYGRLHSAYAQEGLNGSHGVNRMLSSANDSESPYFSHNHRHSPHMGRFDSDMQDSYSPRVFPHEFGGFRPPQQSSYGHMHHPYHEDVRGYYSDASPDRMLHQHRQFLHRPSCSCEHCCNRNLYVPPKFDHFKSQHQPYNHNINHHPNPMLHVSQGYSSGGSTLPSRRSPTLNSADLDYKNVSLDGRRNRKVDVAHGRGRLCHPILGGAPFITCCNCFELLKLPRKHLSLAKKRKMKCGSCFSVIMFELGSKCHVVSVSSHGDPISTNVDVGFIKADLKVWPNKGEFTDKSNYDKPQRQMDPLFAISSISVNKLNTHKGEKLNCDEPEKLLHPLSGNSTILMDKHDMTENPNSDDLEKLIDPTNKSNYDGFGKQVDSFSSMSSSSVSRHYVETNHKSSLDESKKQVDPLSVMSTVSVRNHETDTYKKSKYGAFGKQVDSFSSMSSSSVSEHYVETSYKSSLDESKNQVDPLSVMSTVSVGNHEADKNSKYDESEKQVDTHNSADEHITDTDQKHDDESGKQLDTPFATLHISTDEHITDTDQKHDDESKKQLDTPFATLHISTDEHITEDNLNSDDPEKQLNPLSSASLTSEKHYNLPEKYHVHSSGNNISSQFDEGDQSNRSELALDRATTLQTSVNDSARTGVSVHTFLNKHISNYSGEISEDDHPRVDIKGESFNATEKSSHDTSDYDQSLEFSEFKVFVNGHFIPNRDVKKAEMLAGPIQPGEYWYDIRAGFWGVMDRPCLGIIMPNIEEFNYPLPENCAAGNTGVLVNGRELHQKDLDILASRGLPILKYGSYIVDISGEVVDEHTGEELDSLGKLAPTVEREKRGFGMRVP